MSWLRAIGTTWSAAPRVGCPTSVASRWSCRTHARASPELAVRGPIRARTGASGGSAMGLPAVHHWRVWSRYTTSNRCRGGPPASQSMMTATVAGSPPMLSRRSRTRDVAPRTRVNAPASSGAAASTSARPVRQIVAVPSGSRWTAVMLAPVRRIAVRSGSGQPGLRSWGCRSWAWVSSRCRKTVWAATSTRARLSDRLDADPQQRLRGRRRGRRSEGQGRSGRGHGRPTYSPGRRAVSLLRWGHGRNVKALGSGVQPFLPGSSYPGRPFRLWT